MKKVVIFADVLFAALFTLHFSMQTMSTYAVVEFLVILSFLIAEILIVLFGRRWHTSLKWLGTILTLSVIPLQLPQALLLASLKQYGYVVLLVALFIIALFRSMCSFFVKCKSN